MKEIIYIAKPTEEILGIYPEYKKFFPIFKTTLEKEHKVQVLDLPDIWTRDFLPFQNKKTGKLYSLYFDPPAQPKIKNWYEPKLNESIRSAAAKHFPSAKPLPVRIDGGNLIVNGAGIAFAFYRDAICKKENLPQTENFLKENLGIKSITWLPKEEDDFICHIDGFMQFLEDDILLVSDERCFNKKLFQKRIAIIKKAQPNIKIIQIPCAHSGKIDDISAKGIYVNFLETSKCVFVPQYKHNVSKNMLIIGMIKLLTQKKVIGIDCEAISKHGGALHCLTSAQIIGD
jgi:agmatine/peptidylarginine deiminase